MTWSITENVDDFLAAAGDFLRSRPAAHTVQLSVVERLRLAPRTRAGSAAPVFGWWRAPHAPVTGAFLQTPPRSALLTGMPDAAVAALPAALAATGRALPGAFASCAVGETFIAAWRRHTGDTPRVRMRERLHRLGSLAPPQPAPPGAPRTATKADRDLLIAWYEAFTAEADTEGEAASDVDDRLGYGGLTLWEVGGVPVSLAGRSRLVAGMARISPVYTPPERRGRGFAAAVTAALTQEALDAGAREVVLFTDLANPTSNGVYQRIGYRPVDDYLMLSCGD